MAIFHYTHLRLVVTLAAASNNAIPTKYNIQVNINVNNIPLWVILRCDSEIEGQMV